MFLQFEIEGCLDWGQAGKEYAQSVLLRLALTHTHAHRNPIVFCFPAVFKSCLASELGVRVLGFEHNDPIQ